MKCWKRERIITNFIRVLDCCTANGEGGVMRREEERRKKEKEEVGFGHGDVEQAHEFGFGDWIGRSWNEMACQKKRYKYVEREREQRIGKTKHFSDQ